MLPCKAKPELYSVLDDPQENFNVARKPDNAEVLEKEICKLKNTIRDGGSTALAFFTLFVLFKLLYTA